MTITYTHDNSGEGYFSRDTLLYYASDKVFDDDKQAIEWAMEQNELHAYNRMIYDEQRIEAFLKRPKCMQDLMDMAA